MIVFAWLVFLALSFRIAWINARSGIIPDQLTFRGTICGIIISYFVPSLQNCSEGLPAVAASVLGAATGFFVLWALAATGKFFFGVKRFTFAKPASLKLQIYPPEGYFQLGDLECGWADIFYRDSDRLTLAGQIAIDEPELPNGKGLEAIFSLNRMWLDKREIKVTDLRLVTGRITRASIPRELIGFGVVKLFLFAGAFLGATGVLIYLAFTTSMITAAGGYRYLRSRLSPNRVCNNHLEVGPYASISAILIVGLKAWKWHTG